MMGGHAVCAVGYDDSKVIVNPSNQKSSKGALLIRNSWGSSWGDNGYGWLPYDYVLTGLASDWCLLMGLTRACSELRMSIGGPRITDISYAAWN